MTTTNGQREAVFDLGAVVLVSYGAIVLPLPLAGTMGRLFALACLAIGMVYSYSVNKPAKTKAASKGQSTTSVGFESALLQPARRAAPKRRQVTIIKPIAEESPQARRMHARMARKPAAKKMAKRKTAAAK